MIISSFFISLVNLRVDQRAYSWVLAPIFLSFTSLFQIMKICLIFFFFLRFGGAFERLKSNKSNNKHASFSGY